MAYSITNDCIGCTMCAKNCPVDAITGSLKEAHSINRKRCVDCGVCGKICPKNAIVDQNGKCVQKVSREKWPKPSVDKSSCSACAICVDICKAGCLEIEYPKFKGDLRVAASLHSPKDCVGCGLCARLCPMQAIKMEG